MPRPFKGVIDLDIRQSTPDWDAFLDAKAPKDAPNVLVILYDDTGQAAWSPYGGRINMPTMDRLAKDGLTRRGPLRRGGTQHGWLGGPRFQSASHGICSARTDSAIRSIATPWAGHDAARMGVRFSPAVVNVWNDMVPGSTFIESVLAQPLPAGTEHHLLFTYLRGGMSLGESSDDTVTIACQLDWRAQSDAVQRYGFNESHDGVLEQANVARLVSAILAGTKASLH